MVTSVYPGTFDPITLGHVDIINRASAIFGRVVVGMYATPQKGLLFSTEERMELAQKALKGLPNVDVMPFSGLVVEFAKSVGAAIIVRGLRSGSDFEYEFEMAFMNKRLAPDVDLVCFMTSLEYQFVSSSLLKEVAGLGGNLAGLVPPNVVEAVHHKLGVLDKRA